ncbi:MAG: hypothetical protein GC160_23235 [Acidobacteria bacterium]|nr:hypothetical protein [Acidobacteriota bacterium]
MEVMKILWEVETATVAGVQERLKPSRPLAYTTVMTVLDRLTRKHVAARRKQGRGYVYRPTWSREDACELALDRLLADFFHNDAAKLSGYLRRYQHDEQPERLPRPASYAASQQLDSALL